VIAVQRHAFLTCDETESLTELEQERFDAVDDGLFEVAFAPLGSLAESEELEYERILEDVCWRLDFVPASRERQAGPCPCRDSSRGARRGAMRSAARARGSTSSPERP